MNRRDFFRRCAETAAGIVFQAPLVKAFVPTPPLLQTGHTVWTHWADTCTVIDRTTFLEKWRRAALSMVLYPPAEVPG